MLRVPRRSLGIDPGTTNLGMAVVQECEEPGKVRVFSTGYHEPFSFGKGNEGLRLFTKSFLNSILADIRPDRLDIALKNPDYDIPPPLSFARIERYVPYGINTATSENISYLIGMLQYAIHDHPLLTFWMGKEKPVNIELYRAADWKVQLVKLLAKNFGFDNPSESLDKKFSMAAAKFIVTDTTIIKNDHVADAICLAALPLLEESLRAGSGNASR